MQKLGTLTVRLMATQIYPSIIREQDALETTAHLLWDALREEEPIAETFGLSYATGYLEQVHTLDTQDWWLYEYDRCMMFPFGKPLKGLRV